MLVRHVAPVVLLAALLPDAARASDATTVVYPGITYIKRILSNQRVHILKVDLTLKTIRVHATKPPGGMKTSTFAINNGCVAAINGDFGTRTAPWKTTGLAMGDGKLWTNTSDNSAEGFAAFGQDNHVVVSPPTAVMVKPDPWMSEIVGGRPLIVDQGVARDAIPPYSKEGCGTHFCTKQPRTALGVSKNGQTLIMAVVEGRNSPVAVGMTTKELGTLMKGLGAWTALNQDGGGSSTLYIKKLGGVVSDADPSEGERTVSNHLGFAVVQPYGTLKGFVRTKASNPAAGVSGAKVALSKGASVTTGADGSFQLTQVPSGPVTVTASKDGFVSTQKTVTVFSADTVSTTLVLVPPGVDAGPPDPDGGAVWTDAAVDPDAGVLPDEIDGGAWTSNDQGPAASEEDSGCSCSIGRPIARVPLGLLGLALLALRCGGRRRRR
jgi:hypothetical protein